MNHQVPDLLLRWESPARVLDPLEVLKLDPDVLYVELEQVPEGSQVLRCGLRVGRWVLGLHRDRASLEKLAIFEPKNSGFDL